MSSETEVLVMGSSAPTPWAPSNLGYDIAKYFRDELGCKVFEMDAYDYDLTKEDEIARVVGDYGHVDNVVWCAGHNRLSWIKDLTMQSMEDHFKVNAFSLPLYVAELLRAGHGPVNIVSVLSDSYRVPMRASMAYGASKAAAAYMVKNMARELAGDGWRINGVAPGIIDDTPMTEYIDNAVPIVRGWTKEHAREYEQSMIPMGRRLSKSEVAWAVRDVMMGPEGINGSVIEITGGK